MRSSRLHKPQGPRPAVKTPAGDAIGRRSHFALLILLTLANCGPSPVALPVELADADLRVLFLGNSLTYTNDLPGMVQTIAESTGHTFAQHTIASPNWSLEEHWGFGSQDVVRQVAADVVVLQQGPSSLPESQVHLRFWTARFAEVVTEAGGRPALYMVWPDATRPEAFDAVLEAYRSAADSVDGLFIPAGDAWQRAWALDPDLRLYGPDGFHPSVLGSQIAALTLFRVLFNVPVTGLPSRMVPTTAGLPIVDLGEDAPAVFQAVEEAVGAQLVLGN